MEREIDGVVYELVQSKISGCEGCEFFDNWDKCDACGEKCFKTNHGNDYPMVWKQKPEVVL